MNAFGEEELKVPNILKIYNKKEKLLILVFKTHSHNNVKQMCLPFYLIFNVLIHAI